jgi:hypothetical protein
MYILIDQIDGIRVGEYQDTETPVQIVGGLMTIHGHRMADKRYMLTEKPNRKSMARIVYQPDEMYRRAIVYFNRTANEKRKKK